ncbi:MAG TPA: hypothetical protein VI462_11695 [Acidimicrobiia bacterium]
MLTVDRRWPVPRWLDNATFGTIGANWASQLMLAVTRGMSFLAANPEAPPEPAKPVPPITSRFYKPHPSFPQPAEIDSPLWRYLTVGKFVDLIWRHELWFSRLDRLGDPLEGSLGVPNALRQATDPVVQRNQLQLGSEQMRSHLFVSCWHLSTHESAAMWAGYTHEQEAVAVRSTFRRLVESIEGSDEFFAGEIAYGDHRQTFVSEMNMFDRVMFKNTSFEHEREVRAVIAHSDDAALSPTGLRVPVNLETLIDRVHVAPTAAEWFLDVVTQLGSAFECPAPVVQSDMRID